MEPDNILGLLSCTESNYRQKLPSKQFLMGMTPINFLCGFILAVPPLHMLNSNSATGVQFQSFSVFPSDTWHLQSDIKYLPQSKVLAPSNLFLVYIILQVHVAVFSMNKSN